MGNSSSKNSVYLAKNHTFSLIFTPKSVIGSLFTVKDAMCIRNRDDNLNNNSATTTAFMNYIQTEQTKNVNYQLMRFWATYDKQQTIFSIDFDKNFLNNICRILNDPVFQIKGKVQVPGKSSISFQRSIELGKETIWLSGTTTWELASTQRLLSKNDALELHATGTCDIFVSWSEESEQDSKMESPQPPIKINEKTFTQNLYNMESSKDLNLIARNGTEIKCHRIIFQAHSAVLAAMVTPGNGMSESETGRIEMRENSQEGINQLLKYLYGMELDTTALTCESVVELFQTAHKYELTELQNRLCELLLSKGKDWFTADVLLELYFFVRNLEQFRNLQKHSQTVMLSMSEVIRSCERFQELNQVDALDLVWKLFDLK